MRRVRDARGETEPPAHRRARATYSSDVSDALLLSASESAAAPAGPIRFSCRLQRGEVGQGCSWRDRAAGTEQGARDLLERLQRRVALERLRERDGAHRPDLVFMQPAARRGGSGMRAAKRVAVTNQGAYDLRERLERRVALERLQERRGVHFANLVGQQAAARRGESGMLVEGQGRRHRAGRARLIRAMSASLMHSQARQYFSSPAFELLKHNCFGILLCGSRMLSQIRLQKAPRFTELGTCQCRSTRLVPLPLFLLVVRLRLRASVLSALRPGRDGHTRTVHPARLSTSNRQPALFHRSLQPPCARALLLLNARCTCPGPLRAAWPGLAPAAWQCRSVRRESKAARRRAAARPATAGQRCPRACSSPRGVQRGWLCACCAGASWCVDYGRSTETDFKPGYQYPRLVANKPSGRQIAREPLEDELWTRRALLAASASRCSSWRSDASARGSR
jgi:hypothetical protein